MSPRIALGAATLLALVPWLGLLVDAVEADPAPGSPTSVGCGSAWCFGSMSHLVLRGTLGVAAICAALAAAVALAVLVRGRLRGWAAGVIVAAATAMILYGVLV